MDNPYRYHPTILSRHSWETLFKITGILQQDNVKEDKINNECEHVHPEYDFFVFSK